MIFRLSGIIVKVIIRQIHGFIKQLKNFKEHLEKWQKIIFLI
jgi:hypothetical protein